MTQSSLTTSGTGAPFRTMLSGNRPQEVLTPAAVTDAVRAMFGGPIQLDPCAAHNYYGDDTVRALVAYHGARAGLRPDQVEDGLTLPWRDGTFCNPPYGTLKEWLAKATWESGDGYRIVALVPVRSHRVWWRTARRVATAYPYGAYVELNPVTFVGYPTSFPAPLCLMVYNVPTDVVAGVLKLHPIGEIV